MRSAKISIVVYKKLLTNSRSASDFIRQDAHVASLSWTRPQCVLKNYAQRINVQHKRVHISWVIAHTASQILVNI